MKEDNTIQFYIYPDGFAESMGSDELVLVRNKLGSVDSKFVSDLVQGDYYCKRIPAPLPPRNAKDVLDYIYEKKLSFNWLKLDTDKDESWTYLLEVIGEGGDILVQVGCEDNCIRKALEPLMDLEEL